MKGIISIMSNFHWHEFDYILHPWTIIISGWRSSDAALLITLTYAIMCADPSPPRLPDERTNERVELNAERKFNLTSRSGICTKAGLTRITPLIPPPWFFRSKSRNWDRRSRERKNWEGLAKIHQEKKRESKYEGWAEQDVIYLEVYFLISGRDECKGSWGPVFFGNLIIDV